MDRKNTNTGVLILFLLAIAFFVIGNRLCAVVMESSNPIALLGSSDPLELIGKALSNPMPSGDGAAIAVGILFAVVPMWVVASFRGNEEIRHGDEHGSARLGTVEHARRFTDIKNRDNNIVLTRDIGIAIYPNKYVRDPLPHRNVCVFGSTGSGKTTSYVMPNILQVEADRDLVVVDPKGTTLSMCGHALVEAGIDVRCLNLVDLPKSDHYNPLTNIRDYDDITSVVRLLIRSTNEGKDNSDRIWDAGEALLLRALITLLWDWFPRDELTMQSVVDLEMMAEVKGHFDVNCPLSLIFNQIATGEKTVTTGGRGGESPVAGASGAKVVRVPSLLRRNDGVCPAKVTKADGTHGLDTTNDESLRLWTEFCHAAEKTIQSFVISNHTRLAYLSTPGVLGMLCHNGQPDELNLNLLGQRTDECGDQTRPRVIFAIASDIDSVLSPLLSLFCWQAVKLPVRAAQHYRDGSLPRAVSFIFDEFPNIGRIEDFERMVAAVRSRNIDLSVICQNTSQLDAVYGEATAKTIRDNTSILYLGGGTSYYTAADLSKVIGNTTIYKEDVSRQGTGLGCTASIQRSSMARPLFEPDELMRLPKDEAVVIAGPDGPYQDKKQQVWKCRRYDKTYMARHPKRSFDYMSWKKAGKPYGEKFHAWEEVHFNEVLPARDDLEKKRQAHKWAKNRGDRKRESETMKKLVESCDRLVRAERHAREVATVSDPDSQS